MRLPLAASIVAVGNLFVPTVQGDWKCRQSEKEETTRWGGNEAVIMVPEQHFRELKGVVKILDKQRLEEVLAEVFDKPDHLVNAKPWNEPPQQNRLRAGVTSSDGKFCCKDLPNGTYELRISKDEGWNVTHAFVVIDRKTGTGKPLCVWMQIGT